MFRLIAAYRNEIRFATTPLAPVGGTSPGVIES
jgi:hypothetical protein